MSSSLKSSVNDLHQSSNLASAMLSTEQKGEPRIQYLPIQPKDYSQGPEVTTINPNMGDPNLLKATTTEPVLKSIQDYYTSQGLPADSLNNLWAYVSAPGVWNPTLNANTMKTYTSLLVGDKNHYITLSKSFANALNKNKIPNYVDIWTFYQDGLPLNPQTNKKLTDPLNFVVDPNTKVVLGQSLFRDARVAGIDLKQGFDVSHVLFDIKNNRPVLNSSITPSENNILVNNNDQTYVSSPGVLPNVNTNAADWKITSGGMPDWQKATPNVKGWSVHALYGRIYQSVCHNPSLQIQYPSRVYTPQLNVKNLTSTQKIVAALTDINAVQDPELKQDLSSFNQQFINNDDYQKLIKNLRACLQPSISILEPYYSQGDKEVQWILDDTLNKLSSFFNDIENVCTDPLSFLNTQPIKLSDIIQKHTSLDGLVNSLHAQMETTQFYNIQTKNDDGKQENVIAVYKDPKADINKIVSKNLSDLTKYHKTYSEAELVSSYRNWLNFGLKYGWKLDKFNKDYQNKPQVILEKLKTLEPDFEKIAYLLNQANYLGQYKNLHNLIASFKVAAHPSNDDQLVEAVRYCMNNLMFTAINYNNGMLKMSFKVPGNLPNWADATPLNADYLDTSYAVALVNNSWLSANKNAKAILPADQLNNLMQLPYNEFLTALEQLNDKYKVRVNGLTYLIAGTGISADFAYPLTNEYSFNKANNVVLYLNQLGFEQAAVAAMNPKQLWIGLQPVDHNSLNLAEINKTLSPYFNNQKFYSVTDVSMPNKIMYQSINFPSQLGSQILTIALFVGILVAILCLVIVFMILRHIIKGNVSWIGLAISNGEFKKKFIFINWATALLLALGVGVISGLIISFTYPLLSFFFYVQWTIPLQLPEIFWIIPVIVAALFLIIYLGSILISWVTLRPKLLDLVANNKKSSKWFWRVHLPIPTKIGLHTLMNRFLISRCLKILGVTVVGLIISFLTSVAVIVNGQFNQAYLTSKQNTNYTYAIDLFSPSIQGGGYDLTKFDNIPTSLSKQELAIYQNGGAYASKVKLVTNPYTGDPMTNMWLPDSTTLIKEIQSDLQFLKGKMVNQLALNLSIPYGNNLINLWQFAINIFPAPVISFINNNTNTMLNAAYKFYAAMDSDPQLKADYYGAMKYNKPSNLTANPWTFDGQPINDKDLSNNLLNKTTTGWEWTTTGPKSVIESGLLSAKALNAQAVQLLSYLVTNYQNPVFTSWCQTHGEPVVKPYWLGLNEVVNEPYKSDEPLIESTYTYLDASANKKNYNIQGINVANGYVQLRSADNHNEILNTKLVDSNFSLAALNQNPIPMVISEVAAKQDHKNIGDTYTFSINNNLNRYTWKFNKTANPYDSVTFKVVGIMSDQLKKRYFIDQTIANALLGYDVLPVNQRFNGIYFKSDYPIGLLNLSSLYSPSGISILSTSYPTTFDEMDENILRNALVNGIFELDPATSQPIIDSILGFDLTKEILDVGSGLVNYAGQTQIALNAVKKMNSIFGSTLIQNSIANMDSVALSEGFTNTMDTTISNFSIIFIVAILPILLSINLLFITIVIDDVNAIFGLLLAQGYSKAKTITTFSVYVSLYALLGIVVGSLISLIAPNLFNSIIWSSLGIITTATYYWANILVGIGTFATMAVITEVYGLYKLQKTPLLALLSGYQLN